jgi:hypothetical protein
MTGGGGSVGVGSMGGLNGKASDVSIHFSSTNSISRLESAIEVDEEPEITEVNTQNP